MSTRSDDDRLRVVLVGWGAISRAVVDALSAARSIGLDRVEHRIVKPPRAWVGTPAETLCDLSGLTESTVFFTASAAETASAFPKNANVAINDGGGGGI
ncbi:MAG: hypothetical protein EBV88_08635 [Actinobacteria bacterium]|nr:hypothetical protein [Actinomycetota bacterium]